MFHPKAGTPTTYRRDQLNGLQSKSWVISLTLITSPYNPRKAKIKLKWLEARFYVKPHAHRNTAPVSNPHLPKPYRLYHRERPVFVHATLRIFLAANETFPWIFMYAPWRVSNDRRVTPCSSSLENLLGTPKVRYTWFKDFAATRHDQRPIHLERTVQNCKHVS